MKRLVAIALVTCMASAAYAQLQPVPIEAFSADWEYQTRQNAVYVESTQSGYFLPSSGNTYGDDIHLPPTGEFCEWDITGFDVVYFSRTTAANVPFNMTVNFYDGTTPWAFGPLVHTYTVTGLGTGAHQVIVDWGESIIFPDNFYMEVAFTPIDGTTGMSIAGDLGAEVGITSSDVFPVSNPQGNLLGFSWFGGYTPLLPITHSAWNPPGNFLLSIYGHMVPEPVALGILALGGLLAVRRRR